MHERGHLTTYFGMITTHDVDRSCVHMNNPAIILDTDLGIVISYGDSEMGDIKDHYDKYVKMLSEKMPEEAKSCQLIEFDRFDSALDIDGICTFINYLLNAIPPEKMREILSMNEATLTEKIKSLQACGF